MSHTTYHELMRQTSMCVLILAIAFVGINVGVPSALPPAHGQSINTVIGTILGLAIIAGAVYLITRDRSGVYYRYPYGTYYPTGYYQNGYYQRGYYQNGYYHNGYNTNRVYYRYYGPYATQYPMYRGRWYRGPMPRSWYGNRGCYGAALRYGRCM